MSAVRKLYFTLNGRVDRTTFWVFAFAVTAIATLIWGYGFPQLAHNVLDWDPNSPATFRYLSIGSTVIVLVTSFAISFKRLHDQNRTAWLLLIYFVPLVGQIILIVMLGMVPGTEGENRYGPAPKGAGQQLKLPKRLLAVLLGIPCAAAISLNVVIAIDGDDFPYFYWVTPAAVVLSWIFFTWVLTRRRNTVAMAYLILGILTIAAFLIPVSSLSMIYMARNVSDPIFPPWLWAIVFSILGVTAGIILFFATRAAKPKGETGPSWP